MVKEIHLTRGKVALVDDGDYERVIQYKWQALILSCGTYAIHQNYKKPCLSLHRFIINAKPNELVDHINGNPLDNRKCNLRVATPAQNNMNRRKQKTKTSSKYKGVFPTKSNKWFAFIRVNSKLIRLGVFINEEDAAHAYDEAARKHFGEYARLNLPENLDC